MARSRIAESMGVRGKTWATWGNTQGRLAVEKKVPAKNIMGRDMALPMPDAAEGVLAQAERMNPIFKNTKPPSRATANTQATLPGMRAPADAPPLAEILGPEDESSIGFVVSIARRREALKERWQTLFE